jgi:hypothetical protein
MALWQGAVAAMTKDQVFQVEIPLTAGFAHKDLKELHSAHLCEKKWAISFVYP